MKCREPVQLGEDERGAAIAVEAPDDSMEHLMQEIRLGCLDVCLGKFSTDGHGDGNNSVWRQTSRVRAQAAEITWADATRE